MKLGGTYLVGERGPELLQMGGQGGNVIPNGALDTGRVVADILSKFMQSRRVAPRGEPTFRSVRARNVAHGRIP